MSRSLSQFPPQRHTMRDWLTLHAMSQRDCAGFLGSLASGEAIPASNHAGRDPPYEPLDAEAMWALAVAALRGFLPDHQAVIEDTFAKSQKIAIAGKRKSPRAATIDHGTSKYPTILYRFRGDASDPLMIAHEFGHALQIRASSGRFVAPVVRELCAFLAENALLAHCKANNSAHYESLYKTWQTDNRRYFGKLAKEFGEALSDEENIYEYRWNYPLARFLSLGIPTSLPKAAVWDIFCGDLTLREIMHGMRAMSDQVVTRGAKLPANSVQDKVASQRAPAPIVRGEFRS